MALTTLENKSVFFNSVFIKEQLQINFNA
ncbi:hypothetical protein MELB17_10338 [Marinobacter sp. ELB17]|nr:hypothetical protein MELB17_10338 [Marinobacter sp. ELB17]